MFLVVCFGSSNTPLIDNDLTTAYYQEAMIDKSMISFSYETYNFYPKSVHQYYITFIASFNIT